MPKIRLLTIKCNVPDEVDMDEMYLQYKGEKFWPVDAPYYRMDVDSLAVINHVLEVNKGWNEIELWDLDFVTSNDHLGNFKINIEAQGKYSSSLEVNIKETKTASYYLEYMVL
jgi:hypothetical protein